MASKIARSSSVGASSEAAGGAGDGAGGGGDEGADIVEQGAVVAEAVRDLLRVGEDRAIAECDRAVEVEEEDGVHGVLSVGRFVHHAERLWTEGPERVNAV